MRATVWLLLLLAGPALGAEPPVSVSATLERTSATIGEPLRYTIKVSAPPGTRTTVSGLAAALAAAGMETVPTTAAVRASVLAMAATTGVTLPADLTAEAERTSRVGDQEITSRAWRVMPFRLGRVELAGAKLEWAGPGGEAGGVAVPPVEIEVQKVALPAGAEQAQDKLFDVKPPVGIPGPPERKWLLAGLILLTGALVSLFVWRPDLLWRLLGRGPKPPEPPRPPHVLALDALDRLVAERLLDRGLVREYFGRLSEIVRTYVDARFGLRSMEATTDELTPMLRVHPVLGQQWLDPMRRFLTTCDLAKFARHVPPSNLTEEQTAFARKLVKETMPREDEEKEVKPE